MATATLPIVLPAKQKIRFEIEFVSPWVRAVSPEMIGEVINKLLEDGSIGELITVGEGAEINGWVEHVIPADHEHHPDYDEQQEAYGWYMQQGELTDIKVELTSVQPVHSHILDDPPYICPCGGPEAQTVTPGAGAIAAQVEPEPEEEEPEIPEIGFEKRTDSFVVQITHPLANFLTLDQIGTQVDWVLDEHLSDALYDELENAELPDGYTDIHDHPQDLWDSDDDITVATRPTGQLIEHGDSEPVLDAVEPALPAENGESPFCGVVDCASCKTGKYAKAS